MEQYISVPIRPAKTLVGALFIISIGCGIFTLGRQQNLYGIMAMGGVVVVFGTLLVSVALRHAVRVVKTFVS